MELIETFLRESQSLEEFYAEIFHSAQKNLSLSSETFASFTHQSLLQPAEWFKAFAVLEIAVESGFDPKETENFFKRIFKGYDYNAAVGLNDEDYKFFWEKINLLFDKFAPSSCEALIEKALQRFNPRRNYKDRPMLLKLLEEAVDRGSENAKVLLGYNLCIGFCGEPDKERGSQLMDSVTTPFYKQKAAVYKNYILSSQGKHNEAQAIIDELLANNVDDIILQMAYEQKALFLKLEDKLEESAAYFEKVLANNCSGFSAMHLGFFQYNKGNNLEGLKLMEQAFCYGRPEVARSLFYCYHQSGQEWQDNERGINWLRKAYLYYDPYSTYQLAYLHLYNDEYKDVEKGLAYLDEAIEMNYTDAISCKGYMYYAGDIIERDIEKSVELFNKALELGDGYSAYRLGVINEEGLLSNGESDYKAALEYYEKAAELNNMYGYEMAGRYHRVGATGEPNYEKALEYYTLGAKMGSSYCKVELAFMYEEGEGVEQDAAKMFELVKDAAENGYHYAYFLLGRCYRHGFGTEENPDEAIRYLQMAADANVAKGLTELALCYEEGYGVEENGKKALEYMLKAAEQNYTYAQYKVGCYYLYGLEGVPDDTAESFKWMSKAAESEYPYALMEIGDYYLWDYAGIDEKEKAYPYYMKAAEQGYVNEGLGACLEYGIGVEENEPEGFKYYLKAAEDGYSRGMYNAGRCYYYGFGIKENLQEAFRWFNEAANYNIISATYYKGKMLLNGEGCTQNIEEAITLLTQAAESDHANAQYTLANCYLIGNGVEVDENRAMELFEQAADNGHEGAEKVTGRRRRK
ncbi:tetratricopeptide repeat protein [Bacteroides sp. 519]|uniref:tetratricopeptide repeat protein n=1 Tax=Bacteroides sp. 519 TaxID=2302937 RepID=UPI0013D65463|nr:tetratricopeptide repeat protein [Bacteroides sp. 519]NDV59811.1 sel1 repeat family protein [Bacteroides sp. 519]